MINNLNILPNEIRLKISGFIPIISVKQKGVNHSIKKMFHFRKLCIFYKEVWDSFSVSDYEEWLLNDMIRWMNNDIGTMEEITDQCRRIVTSAFKTTHCENYMDVISCESNYLTKDICRLYFEQLNEEEIQDLVQFCKKIYTSSFIFP